MPPGSSRQRGPELSVLSLSRDADAPHYWSRGRGIGKPVGRIPRPQRLHPPKQPREPPRDRDMREDDCADDEVLSGGGESSDDAGLSDDCDWDDVCGLPLSSRDNARKLFLWINRSYCDWRSVCCNAHSDGATPVFFVGKSKLEWVLRLQSLDIGAGSSQWTIGSEQRPNNISIRSALLALCSVNTA